MLRFTDLTDSNCSKFYGIDKFGPILARIVNLVKRRTKNVSREYVSSFLFAFWNIREYTIGIRVHSLECAHWENMGMLTRYEPIIRAAFAKLICVFLTQ